MSRLWWLEPGWKDACCADCGVNIAADGGDPDWGRCYECFGKYMNRVGTRGVLAELAALGLLAPGIDVDDKPETGPTPDELVAELNALDEQRAEERTLERAREAWEAERDEYGIEVNERVR